MKVLYSTWEWTDERALEGCIVFYWIVGDAWQPETSHPFLSSVLLSWQLSLFLLFFFFWFDPGRFLFTVQNWKINAHAWIIKPTNKKGLWRWAILFFLIKRGGQFWLGIIWRRMSCVNIFHAETLLLGLPSLNLIQTHTSLNVSTAWLINYS